MQIHFAFESVPELCDLSRTQKRAVLFYYDNIQRVIYRSRFDRFFEAGFVGLIILAELAGFAGGFIYWHWSFWGALAGTLIAMTLVMGLSYFIYVYLRIPKFRQFLHSEEAQGLIRRLKKPNEADAA